MSLPRRLLLGIVLVCLSVALGLSVAVFLFLTSSRTAVVVGHDTVVRPTIARDAVIQTGPILPDFRIRDVGPVGVTLALGKTQVGSIEELVDRYAFIAGDPTAQVDKVRGVVVDMAVAAAVRGLAVGLLPVVVFLLLGRHRRGQLFRGLGTRQGLLALLLLLVLPALVWQPWESPAETQEEQGTWETLKDYVGDEAVLPREVRDIEIRTSAVTTSSRRLVLSALGTYSTSKDFYSDAAVAAADLDLRTPEEGETVALLVTDRHDNIGMDRVARAVGDAAGATVVLDGGDDTSTGQPWEAFSLDSLSGAFEDWDRFGVAGNHDHGDFVSSYLADQGWTMLDGEVVDAPWGGTLLGVDDPRSSGLGSWRDETGLSFSEVEERLADMACDGGGRRGAGQHRAGPRRQPRPRGPEPGVRRPGRRRTHARPGRTRCGGGRTETLGYRWTNGTTGGAAYAIAIGSKPRRNADVSLVTYAEGRPVGLQWARLRTDGSWRVGEWEPITPAP